MHTFKWLYKFGLMQPSLGYFLITCFAKFGIFSDQMQLIRKAESYLKLLEYIILNDWNCYHIVFLSTVNGMRIKKLGLGVCIKNRAAL